MSEPSENKDAPVGRDEDRRSGLRIALDLLYMVTGYIAGLFLILIFALMMGLAIGRQIGFNIPSGDDFTAWSLVAMAFLGLAHTFKKGEMIRVGLLLERLHGRPKQVFELLALAVGTIFVTYFTFELGRLAYDSWRFNDISQGVVPVPLWIPQSIGTFGIGLLLVSLIDEMIHVARGNRPSYEREPPATPDELVERVASGGGV